MNADFGKKDNLADVTTNKFAVSGVDPQPMSPESPWYKYYTFLPKAANVDDGSLVQVGGKKYEANPFGLYCMHGNVAEWTRSDMSLIRIKRIRKRFPNIKWFVAVRILNGRNIPQHTHVRDSILINVCLMSVSVSLSKINRIY